MNWGEVAEVEELSEPEFTHHADLSTSGSPPPGVSHLSPDYFRFQSEHIDRHERAYRYPYRVTRPAF